MRLSSSPAIPDLSLGKTALLDDGRHEPLFAFATPRAAFAEVARLDPTRVEFDAKPPPVGRGSPRGPFDSLILHLLALLVIIGWPSQIPADIPAPIPVELVIEQPPPPPPAEPKPRANPAQGRHASDDFAEVAAPKPDKGAGDAAAPSAGEPQPSAAQAQSASAPPSPAPPEPDRPKEETLTEPQPSTAETRVAAVTPPPLPPKPAAPRTQAVLRTPKPLGSEWPLPLETDHPQAPVHAARLVGPAAIRDEYCARLLSLTLRNIGLLPLSAIGARHGQTSVQFRVTGDGTLNSVRVVQSSGYPDIDVKVAQMVLAVGRFPPLPQWIRGEWMDFTFDLRFPHPSQR